MDHLTFSITGALNKFHILSLEMNNNKNVLKRIRNFELSEVIKISLRINFVYQGFQTN